MTRLTIEQVEALIKYFLESMEKKQYLDATDIREDIEAILNDEPQPGKIYALTGNSGNSISDGKSWSNSIVRGISSDEPDLNI